MYEKVETLQQYIGKYRIEDAARGVAIIELEEALKQAGKQSRLYFLLVNILLGIITILGPYYLTIRIACRNLAIYDKMIILVIGIVISKMLLVYFAELQKTINLNARKAVFLRRALGLDYAPLMLTLPAKRIEGGNDPFDISIFPGYLSPACFPLWISAIAISILFYFAFNSINISFYILKFFQITKIQTWLNSCGWVLLIVVFSLTARDIIKKVIWVRWRLLAFSIIAINLSIGPWVFWIEWWILALIIFIYLWYSFRTRLFEKHEKMIVHIIRIISKIMQIEIEEKYEYILYRASLAVYEMERKKYKTDDLEKILVEIEDKYFYNHHGVNGISLLRGMLSRNEWIRKKYGLSKSGGSTLTMQLGRTLFIKQYNKTIRRKILEPFIAKWLESIFTKKEIIKIYIASVRYAKDIMGLPMAINYFLEYKNEKDKITKAEAFFLVERLSNIRDTINKDRVIAKFNVINKTINIDYKDIKEIYERVKESGKITELLEKSS